MGCRCVRSRVGENLHQRGNSENVTTAEVSHQWSLQVYRRDFVDAQLEQAPTTPGMKYRHYSPDAPVILIEPSGSGAGGTTDDDRVEAVHRRALEEVRSILEGRREEALDPTTISLSSLDRTLDPFRVALLLTTAPPGTPLGLWVDSRGGSLGNGGCGSRCGGDQAVADYLSEGASLAATAAEVTVPAVQSSPLMHSTPQDENSAVLATIEAVEVVQYVLGCRGGPDPGADPGSVARGLFAALRLADEMRVSAVVVEGVADRDEGAAVMNRLRKAASRVVRA